MTNIENIQTHTSAHTETQTAKDMEKPIYFQHCECCFFALEHQARGSVACRNFPKYTYVRGACVCVRLPFIIALLFSVFAHKIMEYSVGKGDRG